METVRRAETRDIPRLILLLKQVNRLHFEARPDLFRSGTKYDPAALEEILKDPRKPVFVWCDETDAVQGYAFCQVKEAKDHPLFCDHKELYIDDICVDETMRRKGIGRSLYERCCSFAREENCAILTLNVWEFNEGAAAFYEKMGMRTQRRYMETVLE